MTAPASIPLRSSPWRWVLRLDLLIVAAVCGYLAWTGLQTSGTAGGGTAGCLGGGQDDCAGLLASRWSTWAGLPVGLPATVVYGTMLGVTLFLEPWVPSGPQRLARWLLLALGSGVLVAAGWFVGLQLFWLESTCPTCMLAHAGGLVTFVLVLLAAGLPRGGTVLAVLAGGLLVAVGLPAGQLWGSRPPYELERVVDRHGIAAFHLRPANSTMLPFDAPQPAVTPLDPQASDPESSSAADLPAESETSTSAEPPEGRVELLDGLVRFQLDDHPHVFGQGERNVLVMLFDYNCGHCRRLNRQLAQLAGERPGQWTLVLMASPLHPACNRHVSSDEGIDGSCELARLSLAIWHLEPRKFAEYHAWLFAERVPRSVEAARRQAERLVDPRRLRAALDEGLIDSRLAQQTELYGYVGAGVTPKLLLPRAILTGTPDSAAELRRILRRELAVPSDEAAEDAGR